MSSLRVGGWMWCVVWVVVVGVMTAEGFSSSSVSLACDSLQPGHLASPRNSHPPYRIHITPRTTGYYGKEIVIVRHCEVMN